MFEDQVAARADGVAAIRGEETWTYARLDQTANLLADVLVRRGLTGKLVAIAAERSVEMVVAELAVLKAGAAYLPLDPSYPRERLTFMIDDADVALVITHGRDTADLATGGRPTSSYRELVESPRRAQPAPAAKLPAARPRDRAYVIYTSGSTGRPKGVVAEHRGLANLALAQAEAFGISAGTRVLQFAAFSFDASVSELFTTLVAGGTLIIVDRDNLLPGSLEHVLRRYAVEVVTLPPSLLAVLPPQNLPALRTLVSAGEACTPEIVRRWAGTARFINAYGPTETTVCATLTTCAADGQAPTIGRPLQGASVHVLDGAGLPVPDGVVGELYIGGIGVTRGYLGRPELTAERFVPDPSGDGERLYRTGDLGRRLPNGELAYVGRIDDQLKVRGYRIEPGEIEAVLARRAGVLAVVAARQDVRGDAMLVAWVTPSSANVDEFRAALRAELPEYMIPQQFVLLEDFPRTPGGKVDRSLLPAPQPMAARGKLRELRGPFERRMASLWCELLGVDEVGPDDDFFWLGGHSLLAARLLARASVAFNVELSFGMLFSTDATVSAMAERIALEIIMGADARAFEKAYARVVAMTDAEADAWTPG